MSQIDPKLTGPARAPVDQAERARLEAVGGLVVDTRRSRPRYFDGRFLAARDLTNDQRYLRSRQADLGRAAGSGVVSGLEVFPGPRATQVVIRAGHGLTPSGEPVVLPGAITVDLLDLRQGELLDAHLGLRADRSRASRLRTGAFVLALRPVEYSANPRLGYPTSVHGSRQAEDHDIVEATAVTLVPWPGGSSGGPDAVRRRLAREIFVVQSGQGLAADLVPLAMVYLDGVTVRWVDVDLVRRPVGAEAEDLLGLGLVNRGVRAAFVRQYNQQLDDVLASTGSGNIAAATFFDALPPVGRMPAGAMDTFALTQAFFPPEVDVDVAFVPEDELPVLVEESLVLPPLDLSGTADDLQGAAVLVMVPVPRQLVRRFKASLESVRRPLVTRLGRLPVARTPLLALSRLRLPTVKPAAELTTPQDAATAAWSALLRQVLERGEGLLWYARRRNVNHRVEIEGEVVDIDVSRLDRNE